MKTSEVLGPISHALADDVADRLPSKLVLLISWHACELALRDARAGKRRENPALACLDTLRGHAQPDDLDTACYLFALTYELNMRRTLEN